MVAGLSPGAACGAGRINVPAVTDVRTPQLEHPHPAVGHAPAAGVTAVRPHEPVRPGRQSQ
jgi:hypothetical protein